MTKIKPKSKESKDVEFLRDLAQRLWHIPVMYGVDQSDADRLDSIARKLEKKP